MAFISEFNSLMWGYVLSIILLGTGLVYSIATGFPQLTQFGKIWDSLKANMNGEGGISGFSALCATVGGQVGTGSLVGVASALLAGGPGALFWMWITALFGMVISFAEAVLGQLYHEKSPDGNFYGGAPYYMTKGLHNKTLACLYAAFTVFTMGIAIVMLQTHSIASAVTVIYLGSAFLGGRIAGRRTENKKYLWGLLAGMCYFAVLFLLTLILKRNIDPSSIQTITTACLCMGGGMLGGMLAF